MCVHAEVALGQGGWSVHPDPFIRGDHVFKTPTRPPVRVRRAGRRTPDITDGVSYGWVRVQDRVLAVAVHSAASPEREGTVLIAGSVGRERVTTQRTVLHVARALAAEGWRVVRFDWSGTGLSPWADEAAPGHPRALEQ